MCGVQSRSPLSLGEVRAGRRVVMDSRLLALKHKPAESGESNAQQAERRSKKPIQVVQTPGRPLTD